MTFTMITNFEKSTKINSYGAVEGTGFHVHEYEERKS